MNGVQVTTADGGLRTTATTTTTAAIPQCPDLRYMHPNKDDGEPISHTITRNGVIMTCVREPGDKRVFTKHDEATGKTEKYICSNGKWEKANSQV